MKGWTQTAAINKGNSLNRLLVKKEGNYTSFYINDQLVTSLPFDGNVDSYFGFLVERNQTVEFDNFELKGYKNQ